MTATELLYRAAGEPEVVAAVPAEGRCWLCGAVLPGRAVPYREFVKVTFTDHDKARQWQSDWVCPACAFCADERSALLQARLGKDKPQCMRNYSHFVVAGEWYPLSKAEKKRMVALLPEAALAVIADSGQKHLLFRAQPGLWQFEEQRVVPDMARLESLLAAMCSLLTLFSKHEIETGDYLAHRIVKFGLSSWRVLEGSLRPWRGSSLFALALFLAQKEADVGIGRDGSETDSGSTPEHGLVGVGREAAEVLGHPDGQRAQRGVHEQPEPIRQLTLF